MKLKPFKELISLSKEKLDEALAPMRARQVKAQAELEQAKLDEQLISTESRIQEACAQKTIDFAYLLRLMDEYALAERRKKQYTKIVNELLPEACSGRASSPFLPSSVSGPTGWQSKTVRTRTCLKSGATSSSCR